MQAHTVKAIIFDCFGVLTTDGWLQFRNTHFTKGTDAAQEVDELNHLSDAGLIPERDFIAGIARLSHFREAEVARIVGSHVPNDALFDFIRDELKGKYRIGMLSNVSTDYTAELFTPEQNALFDTKVFSFEVGATKPHPAMYEAIAAKLDLLPEECVFIDDREGFVDGAKQVGMQAFRYVSVDEVRSQLETMLH